MHIREVTKKSDLQKVVSVSQRNNQCSSKKGYFVESSIILDCLEGENESPCTIIYRDNAVSVLHDSTLHNSIGDIVLETETTNINYRGFIGKVVKFWDSISMGLAGYDDPCEFISDVRLHLREGEEIPVID